MDNELVDISTSFRLQLGYSIGHILNDVCASMWFTYFLVFFHLVLGFSASQAGYLMLIGQVVDALATPFVGFHSDRTDNFISARYGKRKIWHFFGTVCVLASFPFIFTECLGCSTTHKWAQMFYFSAFILIFQIGWAAVQISHLSLIPELSEDDHTRSHLTAVRHGFTVFSNLFVYIITWIVLHFTGESGTQQIGPNDAWKFRHIIYIVLSVGAVASILFHLSVNEKYSYRHQEERNDHNDGSAHYDFLRKPLLYQVAGIYMSTRVVGNVSQVLLPLYLHKTLGLAAYALALIPLGMYLGSLFGAAVLRVIPRFFTRKFNYFVGSVCALIGFMWIYFGFVSEPIVYSIAVLIGFGGAVMLVTGLSLTSDLVGATTEASAFVYGIMSFTDKLACGIAIAIIQLYADDADSKYYQYVLSWVCGGATILGLIQTLSLPKFSGATGLVNDSSTNTAAEPSPTLESI